MTHTDQTSYDVQFDWGAAGLSALGDCQRFIIVEVLSFSTCVSIAVERGASVLPFIFDHEAAASFASQRSPRASVGVGLRFRAAARYEEQEHRWWRSTCPSPSTP